MYYVLAKKLIHYLEYSFLSSTQGRLTLTRSMYVPMYFKGIKILLMARPELLQMRERRVCQAK